MAQTAPTAEFKLFVPGPVEIDEATRSIGARQPPYMRTEAFSRFTLDIFDGLKRLVGTSSEVVILTASGTAAMEAAVSSIFDAHDRVLVIDGGTFGRRFVNLCEVHGVPHEVIRLDPGKDLPMDLFAAKVHGGRFTGVLVNAHETSTGALYDIQAMGQVLRGSDTILVVDAISSLLADPYRMDDWGVDVTIFSSQKGLALPPGLSFVALSSRAAARARALPRRTLYLHLGDYLKDAERGQAPYTIAVGIMLQLGHRLAAVHAVGVDRIVADCAARAALFRAGLRGLPLEVLPERPSNALTALRLSRPGLAAPDLVRRLSDQFGIVVAPNAEPLRQRVFRVGHLGALTIEDVKKVLAALRTLLAGEAKEAS